MATKRYSYLKEIEIRYKIRRTKNKIIGKSVSGGADVVARLFSDLQNEGKEKFITINLNTQNKIICFEVVAIGSVDRVFLRPMEAFRSSIMVNAYAAIVVHNHPSGEAKPSRADVLFTQEIVKASLNLGLRLYDHIIIGQKKHYSFARHGKMVHTLETNNRLLGEEIQKTKSKGRIKEI